MRGAQTLCENLRKHYVKNARGEIMDKTKLHNNNNKRTQILKGNRTNQ
jgi:hypothetical protein